MTRHPAIDEPVREQAAQWVVRLAAPDISETEALAFDAWIDAAPGHAAAYDEALSAWLELGANAGGVLAALNSRKAAVQSRARRMFAGAGLAAAAAIAAVAVVPQLINPPTPQTYATAVGEHRTVALADGSKIDLNGATRLSVVLKGRERDVVMDQGEAVFDVAHDPRRPFFIAAGDRQVRVVGTQFDVKRRGGRLTVAVARGTVEVRPAGDAAGMAFRLHPGQRLEHREGRPDARIGQVSPEEALAWRTGRLVYRGEPLSDVVADLNAEFHRPITVADPGLGAEPISGVLILDDETAVVRRLALLVSAQAVPSDGGVVLQRNETPRR